jgi:hypothetical protein
MYGNLFTDPPQAYFCQGQQSVEGIIGLINQAGGGALSFGDYTSQRLCTNFAMGGLTCPYKQVGKCNTWNLFLVFPQAGVCKSTNGTTVSNEYSANGKKNSMYSCKDDKGRVWSNPITAWMP